MWYLGVYLEAAEDAQEYMIDKVASWVKSVELFDIIADKYPQSAFSGLVSSLHNDWAHIQYITAHTDDEFLPLYHALTKACQTDIFGVKGVQMGLLKTTSLPVIIVGLVILHPSSEYPLDHATSISSTDHVVVVILGEGTFDTNIHPTKMTSGQTSVSSKKGESYSSYYAATIYVFTEYIKRPMERAS